MHYRHSYHAGNFADVFKHSLLTLLLVALRRKPAPFCYLETHAGAGLYDLRGGHAQKTGEWRDGIGRLWSAAQRLPELAEYFAAVRAVNPAARRRETPRYYPGSPAIARALRRPQDQLILVESEQEPYEQLKQLFVRTPDVALHRQDGYQGLKAFLPPHAARGLVLIDPPFEAAAEYQQAQAALRTAQSRWPQACHALWYPIKDRAPVTRMQRELSGSGIRKLLCAELCVLPEDVALRLNGCGMIVINPPWQFDVTLQTLLPKLRDVLRVEGAGSARVGWLVPE